MLIVLDALGASLLSHFHTFTLISYPYRNYFERQIGGTERNYIPAHWQRGRRTRTTHSSLTSLRAQTWTTAPMLIVLDCSCNKGRTFISKTKTFPLDLSGVPTKKSAARVRATDSPNNNLITEKSVAKGNDLKTFHLYQCKYRAKQKSPEQKIRDSRLFLPEKRRYFTFCFSESEMSFFSSNTRSCVALRFSGLYMLLYSVFTSLNCILSKSEALPFICKAKRTGASVSI